MKRYNTYYEEALSIADQLVEKAIHTELGVYWETAGIEKGVVYQRVTDNLYSGVSGIAFFLLEVYRVSGDSKYEEIIRKAASWLRHYCQQNDTEQFAFYTGRLGVAYFFLKLYEVLGDESYLQNCLDLAKQSEKHFEKDRSIDDLINGVSGIILGLLHIHAATEDPEILVLIERFTDQLIQGMQIDKHGIYFDRSTKNIKGLCGFSHGASGIGYVFLELGRYFINPTFYWISEQCFAYENANFNQQTNNWPDYRKSYYDDPSEQEFKEKYAKNDRDFFETPGDMTAWCHGAPGIGLSRIRAYEILRSPEYREDIEKAINKVLEVSGGTHSYNGSFTLCHGHLGNAMPLLEAYRILQDDSLLEHVEHIADLALKHKTSYGIYTSGYAKKGLEDLSLFIGLAGVGYGYLMLATEGYYRSTIMKPDVQKKFQKVTEGILAIDDKGLMQLVYMNLFPRYSAKVPDLAIGFEKFDFHSFSKAKFINQVMACAEDKTLLELDLMHIKIVDEAPGDA